MPVKDESVIPLAVRQATAALDLLRVEDAALAAEVEKALPSYALRQSQAGRDTSVDALLAMARQGASAIKSAFATANQSVSLQQEHARLKQNNTWTSRPRDYQPLTIAAMAGDVAEINRLISEGADVQSGQNLALRFAVRHRHRKAVEALLSHLPDLATLNYGSHTGLLEEAAQSGDCDILRLLVDHGVTDMRYGDALKAAIRGHHAAAADFVLHNIKHMAAHKNDALRQAVEDGKIDIAKILLAHGADVNATDNNGNAIITYAAIGKHDDMMRFLFKNKAKIDDGAALLAAYQHSSIECMRVLLENGADATQKGNAFLRTAEREGEIDIIALLLDYGGDETRLSAQTRASVAIYREDIQRWKNTVRQEPPRGLASHDARAFKVPLFATLKKMFKAEGYPHIVGHKLAYNTMALFQTEGRIAQYLRKWGSECAQPLHNVTQMIKLPHDLSQVNIAAWGDAVLQHGPKMARLVKFCDHMPQPLRSDDGKSWSYLRTRAAVAQFAYARAGEHPALAALCFEHALKEQDFNRALALCQQERPARKNIPEMNIDGSAFGMDNAAFKKLDDDDFRGLLLGELTDCCQSIGGQGQVCAEHGFTSENGGFYVIETKEGEIIGQCWAWRGSDGEMCFDSLETLGSRVSGTQWQQLIDETVRQLSARTDHNVTALHIGIGGATPSNIHAQFGEAAARPVDYKGYRDSDIQVRAWKR